MSTPPGPPPPKARPAHGGALCAGRGPSRANTVIPMTPRGGVTGVCAVSRSREVQSPGKDLAQFQHLDARRTDRQTGQLELRTDGGRRVMGSRREGVRAAVVEGSKQLSKEGRGGGRRGGSGRPWVPARWTHSPAWPMPGPCTARICRAAWLRDCYIRSPRNTKLSPELGRSSPSF